MRRLAVRGIIIKDGKLFAQRLKKRDGGVKDFWCTPGGGLEDGESLHQGLTREMIEETGVEPQIGKLLFIQQYADEQKEYLEFFFEITNVEDYDNVDLKTTSHGPIEVFENKFISPREENLLPEFLRETDLTNQSEPKVFNYL